jgi:hypothetical protein
VLHIRFDNGFNNISISDTVLAGILMIITTMQAYAQSDEEYQEIFTLVIECLDEYESGQQITRERSQECFETLGQAYQVLLNVDLSQYSAETQEIGMQAAQRLAPYTSNTPITGPGGSSNGGSTSLGRPESTDIPSGSSETGIGNLFGPCSGINPNTGQSFDYSCDFSGGGVDPQGNVFEQTPGGDFVAPPGTDVTPLEPTE